MPLDFSGSIPEFYDEHLGPVIFAPYAEDLVKRVARRVKSGRLLEIACGTGVLTRRLDAALKKTVEIVATDLNADMVARARSKVPPSKRLEWRTADAASLPFPDGSFDGVVCQFGLMFVPDKAAAFREARRVVREGGSFDFSVWCRIEDNPFARVTHEKVGSFFQGEPPYFYQVPFGFHDAEVIARHLEENRFVDARIEQVTKEAVAPWVHNFARGLVEGNPIAIAIRDAGLSFPKIVTAVAAALNVVGGDAPFRSKMNALVVSARAG
jgi:ubiquinone/menaquinone biosynthesis C-methylase UbiE